MTASARQPPRVSERIHARLRGEILEGSLARGDALPSERTLAEEFGANRHAVREALKRLEQAGLVAISQGGATRVRDWRDSGGLEVLLDLLRDSEGPPPAELIRSVLEMRATIGVDAARLCAERAADRERGRIGELAERAAASIDAPDTDAELDELHAELWRLIVVGSGNLAFRLALNSLVAAVAAYAEIAEALRPSDVEGLRALGQAVAAGEPAAAAGAAKRLLEPDIAKLG